MLNDGATIRNVDGFIYGPILSAAFEVYLCDRLSVSLQVRERCLFGSTVGKFHTEVGVGVKILIN